MIKVDDMAKITCLMMDRDVKDFCCANASIEEQIKDSYFITLLKQAYGYQILIERQIVGYYMLYFKNIKLDVVNQILEEEYFSNMADFYIAMHIRYLAIDRKVQHQGIGTVVLKGIIAEILKLSKSYPIRIITIDALQEYYEWYQHIGFRELPGHGRDGIIVPMFIDCMSKADAESLQRYCCDSI